MRQRQIMTMKTIIYNLFHIRRVHKLERLQSAKGLSGSARKRTAKGQTLTALASNELFFPGPRFFRNIPHRS